MSNHEFPRILRARQGMYDIVRGILDRLCNFSNRSIYGDYKVGIAGKQKARICNLASQWRQ
jgi:hypothetical protein